MLPGAEMSGVLLGFFLGMAVFSSAPWLAKACGDVREFFVIDRIIKFGKYL